MIDNLLLAAVIAIAVGGAVWDIAQRRLPNFLCLALAITSIGYTFGAFGLDGLGSAAIHAIIALLAGMALFAAGVFGGGDAKFYAAGAFAVPLGKALAMLLWTVLAGLVLLIVTVIVRRLIIKTSETLSQLRKVELPYGVAIASGLAITLLGY